MFVTIYDDQDEIAMQRKLGDDEILTPRIYADEYAKAYGVEIDDSDGYVFYRCGAPINVELADEPDSGSCWTHEAFYIKAE